MVIPSYALCFSLGACMDLRWQAFFVGRTRITYLALVARHISDQGRGPEIQIPPRWTHTHQEGTEVAYGSTNCQSKDE